MSNQDLLDTIWLYVYLLLFFIYLFFAVKNIFLSAAAEQLFGCCTLNFACMVALPVFFSISIFAMMHALNICYTNTLRVTF